jgi:hypothetical protein
MFPNQSKRTQPFAKFCLLPGQPDTIRGYMKIACCVCTQARENEQGYLYSKAFGPFIFLQTFAHDRCNTWYKEFLDFVAMAVRERMISNLVLFSSVFCRDMMRDLVLVCNALADDTRTMYSVIASGMYGP